jgi:hypothetical protein
MKKQIIHKASSASPKSYLKPICRLVGRVSEDWIIVKEWTLVTCKNCLGSSEAKQERVKK